MLNIDFRILERLEEGVQGCVLFAFEGEGVAEGCFALEGGLEGGVALRYIVFLLVLVLVLVRWCRVRM